jgi:hypothetical protein
MQVLGQTGDFVMRRTIAVLASSAVLASAAASLALIPEGTSVHAAAQATFHVPADDGYGVGDCLSKGGGCGQVIADAWCETHGFARATDYRSTGPEDVVTPIVLASTAQEERPVAITCGR